MTETPEVRKSLWSKAWGWAFGLYMTVAMISFPYREWTVANKSNFLGWITLGQFVAAAESLAWPWYAYSSLPGTSHEPADDPLVRTSDGKTVRLSQVSDDELDQAIQKAQSKQKQP